VEKLHSSEAKRGFVKGIEKSIGSARTFSLAEKRNTAFPIIDCSTHDNDAKKTHTGSANRRSETGRVLREQRRIRSSGSARDTVRD